MGEAKRRKAILGDRYGTKETSKKLPQPSQIVTPIPKGVKMRPDYGTYWVDKNGLKPQYVCIEKPMVDIGQKEANINWVAFGHVATLIVTPEFARNYSPYQVLHIVPDPDDAYYSQLGERVIPFKLVPDSDSDSEPEDEELRHVQATVYDLSAS